MKKTSFTKMFVAIALTLSVVSCKDSVLEDSSNFKRSESESEIENIEVMSKTKLFRKSVEVTDKSGANKITLLVASSSEKQLEYFIATNQFGLNVFSDLPSFLSTFGLSESKSDNKSAAGKVEASTGNGIHIEIQKKSLVNDGSFFTLHVKNSAASSKNAKVNYANETNYYTSNGANNGTMVVARSPYVENGGTSVNAYIDYSFAIRTRFSDYSTQVYATFVTAPHFGDYNYSFRGRIRVNYDDSLDYYVNF